MSRFVVSEQREDWNKIAVAWKKWDSHLMASLRPVGEKILDMAKINPSDTVLDVATGSGEPGLTAASRVGKLGKVIGLDISEEMIKIATQKAQKLGIGNYEARVYSGQDLPFGSNSFDAVISRFGVMFFPDVAQGLKEMVRVLKEGRCLCVSVWGPQNRIAKSVMQFLTERLHLPTPLADSPNPFRCSENGGIIFLLHDAGLRRINQVEVTSWRKYSSVFQYLEYILDTNLMINRVFNACDQPTRNEIEAGMAEIASPAETKNGELALDWTAWVASGIK